jgi:hypothetical protein
VPGRAASCYLPALPKRLLNSHPPLDRSLATAWGASQRQLGSPYQPTEGPHEPGRVVQRGPSLDEGCRSERSHPMPMVPLVAPATAVSTGSTVVAREHNGQGGGLVQRRNPFFGSRVVAITLQGQGRKS